MNFTREPIVETIISAREGYKLSIKSSKHASSEEYLVDAVEVISFSGALFYRSQEKPKPFFLPIHDYEVQEVREARLTIKSPVMEKSIKISGGKEGGKQPKAEAEEKPVATSEESAPPEKENGEQKREKKQKFRRKRGFEEGAKEAVLREVKQLSDESAPLVESPFSYLLKPPEALISDSIHKYKKMEEGVPLSPEVSETLQVVESHPLAMEKQEDPEFFSESPRGYERFEEEMIDTVFSPMEVEKPQE